MAGLGSRRPLARCGRRRRIAKTFRGGLAEPRRRRPRGLCAMVRGSGSHRGERPVSNGADSQLMAQFNVEVDQHLAAIEPVLGMAEPEALTRSDIDLLFREFHSIKGLARVVAATGMERLTHEAENLLSPVRSGDRSFDTTIQEPLIAATDALRMRSPSRSDGRRQSRSSRPCVPRRL